MEIQVITVHNKQDSRDESFTAIEALDWLETIGLHAAHEMYSSKDVSRLMNFGRAV